MVTIRSVGHSAVLPFETVANAAEYRVEKDGSLPLPAPPASFIIPSSWKRLSDFPLVAQVRQRPFAKKEDPYIAAVRDAFVRYAYEAATQEIPPVWDFMPEETKIACENARSSLQRNRPADFDSFNTPEERKGYLYYRGEFSKSLPTLVGVDTQSNSVFLRYKGVELTLVVGHPPQGFSACHGPRTAPQIVIEDLDLPVASQYGYCNGFETSSDLFHRLEDHLQMLEDLVRFSEDIKREKKVSALEGEALYVVGREGDRQVRFYLKEGRGRFVDRFNGKFEPVQRTPGNFRLRPEWECLEERRLEREKDRPRLPEGDIEDWAMMFLRGDPFLPENRPKKEELLDLGP